MVVMCSPAFDCSCRRGHTCLAVACSRGVACAGSVVCWFWDEQCEPIIWLCTIQCGLPFYVDGVSATVMYWAINLSLAIRYFQVGWERWHHCVVYDDLVCPGWAGQLAHHHHCHCTTFTGTMTMIKSRYCFSALPNHAVPSVTDSQFMRSV